jgi:hypothetical protein
MDVSGSVCWQSTIRGCMPSDRGIAGRDGPRLPLTVPARNDDGVPTLEEAFEAARRGRGDDN